MNAVKFIGLVVAPAVLLLSGCASYPISKEVRQQARQVTFSQVRADPVGTRGTVVIWGGRIINVVNGPHGGSIYIVCLPLPDSGEPMARGPSPGRFIATSPDYLEPQMLPQGSRITVAGSLNGVLTEQLGKMPYAYPVLEIKEFHVWPPKAGEDYPDYSGYPDYGYYGPNWNWYGGWGWGWGPGWGWWGYPYYPFYYGGYYHGYYHGSYHGGGGSYHGGGGQGGGGWGGGGGGSFHGGGGGGGGHGR